jgi:hypothetical protein
MVASARRVAHHAARRRLLRLAQARRRLLRLRRAFGCLSTSRGSLRRSLSTTLPRAGSSSTTSPPPHVRVLRHVARLVTRLIAPLVVEYSASRRLIVNYFASVACPGASARHAARHAARYATRRRLLRLAQAHHQLLHLRRAFGCLGTSRGSSRGSSHRSSSTTSPLSRVRVPRHVARLVTRLVAPLVIDYCASRRLVVDYFASAARPGASTRHAALHAARRAACRRPLRLVQARRRLLRLRRASVCLGTSHGSSRGSSRRSSSTTPPRAGSSLTTPPHAGSSSTTSPPLRDRVPRHVARLITRILAQARRRLLRLRRASGYLGTSRGSSQGSSCCSSSTTSPPPRVRVPRHVARLVTRLVVDYFSYAARLGASARRVAHCLSLTTSPTPRDRVPRHVARLVAWLVAPLVVDYFAYAARLGASACRAARHAAHRRLLRAP